VAALCSTKACVDLTDDAAASHYNKACGDLTGDAFMDCEDVDYVDDHDLSGSMVISSGVGVYHDQEELTYSWAAREAIVRSQGASSTASLAHNNHRG
jgi:hypothetical protein